MNLVKSTVVPDTLPQTRYRNLARIAAALSCCLLAGTVSRAQATSTTSATPPHVVITTQLSKPQAAVAANTLVPEDTLHQGVEVHGHWKIQIRNPDGSLVSDREFDNELVDLGALLSYLLSGTAVVGEPALFVNSGLVFDMGTPCTAGGFTCLVVAMNPTGFWSTSTQCGTLPASCTYNLAQQITTHNFQTVLGQASRYSLVLSGQSTAPVDMVIQTVASKYAFCLPTQPGTSALSPSQCSSPSSLPAGTTVNVYPSPAQPLNNRFTFTSTTLPKPYPTVTAGQTIQISVTLSFS